MKPNLWLTQRVKVLQIPATQNYTLNAMAQTSGLKLTTQNHFYRPQWNCSWGITTRMQPVWKTMLPGLRFQAALCRKYRQDTRYSATLREYMMYAAVPV